MDVRLSGEQLALRASARRVVDQLGPKTVADLANTERIAKLDAAVTASGWRELRSAADHGAPWATGVEAAIVAEELGRGLADTPFIGPTLATDLRRRAHLAPSTTAPAETVAFDPDLSAPGDAIAIDAAGATTTLVIAGSQLQAAPVGQPEIVDLTRPSAAVETAAGRTTLADAPDLTAWTALGLALACADLVGTMRGAISLATGYASDRHQYGVAVGSFQAVQHLLADAFVAMEGSSSVALHAAWAVDALPPDDALYAGAVAKAYCARAARSVCETVIQVHGGIGNTWDCLAHIYLRRALLSIDLLGGVGPNLARVLAHEGIGAQPIGREPIGREHGLR